MKDEDIDRSKPYRVHVRLTKSENNRVEKEAEKLRKSKARILRDSFFKRVPTKILMSQENFDKFVSQFNRLGNNINQIARKLNSGEVVLSNSFDEFRDDLKNLLRFIMRSNGLR